MSHTETDFNLYSDEVRAAKSEAPRINQYSEYRDLVYYESSVTPGLRLAMIVQKPKEPGYIRATTHGWHMSLRDYEPNNEAPTSRYLVVEVDMRGRAHSDGKQDCNGFELYDVIDAVEYVKKHYADYILDPEVVYYAGGSGSGGNGYEILVKFPDYFAAATVTFGISDYAKWYRDDNVLGEFRDEMDVWIGTTPEKNEMAYRSRSGIDGICNLMTPLFIGHGEKDPRVQVVQAREYVNAAQASGKGNLVTYYEMAGVGTRNHMGNATEEQIRTLDHMGEENRAANRVPIILPQSGSLAIHGYLVTKRFSVMLDSIDKVALIDYDLRKKEFHLHCEVPVDYTLKLL